MRTIIEDFDPFWSVSFSYCFQESVFSLDFDGFTMICPSVHFFEFILPEFIEILGWADLYFLSNLGNYPSLFIQIFFLYLSSVLFFWYLMVFHRSLRLSSFLFILFSFCTSYWVISIPDHLKTCLQVTWFFILPVQTYCWVPVMIFSFPLLHLSTPGFLFGSFL